MELFDLFDMMDNDEAGFEALLDRAADVAPPPDMGKFSQAIAGADTSRAFTNNDMENGPGFSMSPDTPPINPDVMPAPPGGLGQIPQPGESTGPEGPDTAKILDALGKQFLGAKEPGEFQSQFAPVPGNFRPSNARVQAQVNPGAALASQPVDPLKGLFEIIMGGRR